VIGDALGQASYHGTMPFSAVPRDGETTCKRPMGVSTLTLFGLSQKGPDPQANDKLMWDGLWEGNPVFRNK